MWALVFLHSLELGKQTTPTRGIEVCDWHVDKTDSAVARDGAENDNQTTNTVQTVCFSIWTPPFPPMSLHMMTACEFVEGFKLQSNRYAPFLSAESSATGLHYL